MNLTEGLGGMLNIGEIEAGGTARLTLTQRESGAYKSTLGEGLIRGNIVKITAGKQAAGIGKMTEPLTA